MTASLHVQFDFDRVNLNAHLKRVEGLEMRGSDMRPALEDVYAQFLMTERGIFAHKGVGATPWEPLTTKYLRRKTAQGYDPRIMRRTGALAAALTTGRGAGAVKEITPEGLTMGTNLREALFAQRGHGRRRRRLLVIDGRRRARWAAIIRHYLLDQQQAGGQP